MTEIEALVVEYLKNPSRDSEIPDEVFAAIAGFRIYRVYVLADVKYSGTKRDDIGYVRPTGVTVYLTQGDDGLWRLPIVSCRDLPKYTGKCSIDYVGSGLCNYEGIRSWGELLLLNGEWDKTRFRGQFFSIDSLPESIDPVHKEGFIPCAHGHLNLTIAALD